MLDRVSIFSDPSIVDLLRTKFVPLAVDAWYLNRREDEEGVFYRKVVTQEASRKDMNQSTQGRYAFSADGTLFGFNNNRSVERIQQLLRKALDKYQPADAAPLEATKKQPAFDRTIKEGTVVANVYAKVLGGQEESANKLTQIFQASIGEDRLWIRKDEAEALSRGELPDGLKRRIARFHLNDFTRGEPSMWEPGEIRKLEMTLKDGRFEGSVHLETANGKRGFEADLLGVVEAKDGKLVRFDVVAKGQFWGAGRYTNTAGTPKGKFPLAVSFSLADLTLEASKVPPQGSRDINGYLK